MSIGSSSWVSIEPQIIDRVVAGIHKHFAETDVTVRILKGSGPLEALEQVVEASKLWTRSPGSSWVPITTTICMNCKSGILGSGAIPGSQLNAAVKELL
jgi:hypothetical protein